MARRNRHYMFTRNGERDALQFMDGLKQRLELCRRTEYSPQAWMNMITRIEGDIEEYLIEQGYWISEDDEVAGGS